MVRAIVELIANAAGIFSNWFRYKSSGTAQRREAEGIVVKGELDAEKRRADVNRAVHEGDAAAVNRIVNGFGIAVIVSAFLYADACFVCGCISTPPAPRYVAADREVTCVTNETGMVEYWKVPPLVMEELLNAKLELGELKKENKVKEITK